MIGAGLLAGIGFTMSIFIALLSYKGYTEIQDEAKFAICSFCYFWIFWLFLLKLLAKRKVTISDYKENI